MELGVKSTEIIHREGIIELGADFSKVRGSLNLVVAGISEVGLAK